MIEFGIRNVEMLVRGGRVCISKWGWEDVDREVGRILRGFEVKEGKGRYDFFC